MDEMTRPRRPSELTDCMAADPASAETNNENSPLIYYQLSTAISAEFSHRPIEPGPVRGLSTFMGVVVPCMLSMFSVILFLRMGYVVGQCGLILTIVMFVLAYFIVAMTVLSICAISTNGAIEGGGAYFMISRTLGPEFGGSIGLMFFLANIFSSGLYVIGLKEALVSTFPRSEYPHGFLESNTYIDMACSTGILFFCLIVCLIGAKMFARTSVFIFFIVIVSATSIYLSFIVKYHGMEHFDLSVHNETVQAWYTGFNLTTLKGNILENYRSDYTQASSVDLDFLTVFAVIFNGCTGIMAGANMSGELKNPGRSIPVGTIAACVITFFVYITLSVFIAATCERWIVVGGIVAATLSAALSCLIGASRVLTQLAKDEIFGILLRPVVKGISQWGNPYAAVIISWFLVQMVLFMNALNTIAPIVTQLFLFAYSATNMACLALELASAPNFRPSFKYFSWHTCVLGLLGSLTMMFLINPIYAAAGIAVLILLVFILYVRSPPVNWGFISQAMIYHQVRKYLLLLDRRKNHVKFWRPQILLLVSNPRCSAPLIDFVNDIKKSGLYVIGNVKVGSLAACVRDPISDETVVWIDLIDHLKVKAFVEIVLCETVRAGAENLVRTAGLGGMKPTTVIVGFYDNTPPEDCLANVRSRVRFFGSPQPFMSPLPNMRPSTGEKQLSAEEYVHIINDTLKMNKDVCLARHFLKLDKQGLGDGKQTRYIDVWPVNFLQPSTSSYLDTSGLFLLQMACVLHMVPVWRKSTKLRIFLCVDADDSHAAHKESNMKDLLKQIRIKAKVVRLDWSQVCAFFHPGSVGTGAAVSDHWVDTPDAYLSCYNYHIKEYSTDTAVVFINMPAPPKDEAYFSRYLTQLDIVSSDLPPTMLVCGVSAVTCVNL